MQKLPAAQGFLSKLESSGQFIGLAAVICGIIWFIDALTFLRIPGIRLIFIVQMLVSASLLIALGLVYCINYLNTLFAQPTPKLLAKANDLTLRLAPHKRNLGIAGIVIGILYLL